MESPYHSYEVEVTDQERRKHLLNQLLKITRISVNPVTSKESILFRAQEHDFAEIEYKFEGLRVSKSEIPKSLRDGIELMANPS